MIEIENSVDPNMNQAIVIEYQLDHIFSQFNSQILNMQYFITKLHNHTTTL